MFRWLSLGVLVACLGISVHYRRRARIEGGTIPRAREDPLFIAARIAVALPLWLAIVVYVSNPRWMLWASFPSPEWLRWVGVGLGILSVPAAYWVFSSIGQNVSETVLTKEHHELVTHGPYHWIRHPLYTMGLALLGGIGLMAANWFILLYCLVALIAVRMVVIPREESALIATFGDRYRDYMGRTGAMVPKLMGRS
ncbi:MAG: isoprenylcysteine carboxylmethyltransferase family protein [Gemmatimonadota bacterium]|nr:isoprenylcysteine carboxylmethyltransferase family protein [Gemmatimonadota bacterium]